MVEGGTSADAAWRVHGLFLALVLYGLLSAPAPPALRAAETVIGALLLCAMGVRRPLLVATGHALGTPGLPSWQAAGILALAWLLWVPLLRGMALGWAARDMLRDVVPLLYLFLPVLLVPVLRHAGRRAVEALALGLALAGLLFTLRWWWQAEWGFGAVGTRVMPEGDAYLLNAPSVLFAAVALPVWAFDLALRGGGLRRCAAAGLAVGGVLCLAALAGTVHRVALGLSILSFLILALWWLRRAPLPMLVLLLAAGGLSLAFADMLLGAFGQVAEKTRITGANARWEEMAAMLALLGESPFSFLFGQGWGALVANPAVGGWRVSYTHSLFSYTLVKAGTLGFLMLFGYLWAMAWQARALLRENPPLAWALLPPLLMALGFHTSFKYLDTGLLLTLAMLAAERWNRLSVR
jgi:hypothetical protein